MAKGEYAFPLTAFPKVMRDYIKEAAANVGCHRSYVALPLLAALGRAIGNQKVLKLQNGYDYPAVIWGAIISKSGDKKTHARNHALRFLKNIQDKHPNVSILSDTANIVGIRDSLIRQQDTSLLVKPDEVSGILQSFTKGGTQSDDKSHWLSFWGADSLTMNRGHSRVHIPRAAISIFGGIQPGAFQDVMAKEKKLQSGLLPRFLLSHNPPKQSPSMGLPTTKIQPATRKALSRVFYKLVDTEVIVKGKTFIKPAPIRSSAGAYKVFDAFVKRNNKEANRLDEELKAAWIKLEQYVARFALIFQLVESAPLKTDPDNPVEVSIATMQHAIEVVDWFKHEVRKVYAMLNEDPQDRTRRELVDLMKRNGGTMAARDLQQQSSFYRSKSAQDAEDALNDLVKHGFVTSKMMKSKGGGRAVKRYSVA